ncbi:MAG: L,D-transpeptidase family protein [bacterium]
MDKPRRWPWAVGLVLLIVVAIGSAVWFRAQSPAAPIMIANEQGAIEVPVVTNEPVSPSVATQAMPEAGITHPSDQTNLTDLSDAKLKPTAPVRLSEADAYLAAGKKETARETYYEALAAGPDDSLRATIEEKLGRLNAEMIRLPWPMAEKQDYVVQTNDAIKTIARKFGTTVEMIVKGNELKRPDIIRPGQRLKVFTGKMEMVVSKSRHDLLLTANGRFLKRYRVATGRFEKTPVGTFAVSERIPEPPWHREDGRIVPFGDKENILGSRWMGLKAAGNTPEIKGYGIHGTSDLASLGKSESAGCIRLKNEDVEELFELVPVGTPVVIQE